MNHLTKEDYERYMDTEDLSEEYVRWMDAVESHLSECPACNAKMQKMMQMNIMLDEAFEGNGFALLASEEEIRRGILIAKLACIGKEQRLQQVAELICSGKVWNRTVHREVLMRPRTAVRGELVQKDCKDGKEGYQADVTWRNGRICVEISGHVSENLMVILNPESGTDREPLVGEAVCIEDRQIAEVFFDKAEIPEQYKLFICPLKKDEKILREFENSSVLYTESEKKSQAEVSYE